ncbi:class I SAM-dependent methyltransferase [Crocinitomix catalasitica]|nr:class I SAM-dependent methyltransferase [Crocinitomix catalasitica]
MDDKEKKLKKNLDTLREKEGQLMDHIGAMYSKPSHRKRMEMIYAELGPQIQGKTMLDVGCAEGDYTEFARNHGATRSIGVDISASKIKKAKEKFPLAEFMTLDGDDMSALSEEFDVVFSAETIQHSTNYKEFVRELVKKIKPNGLLITTTPNLSTSGKNEFADIDENMSPDELLHQVGGGGYGKQNAVWKFDTKTLIEEIEASTTLTLEKRIPVDTPDREIKELWSILVFRKK